MTELLLHMFVRSDDYGNPKTRAAVGRMAGLTGIVCNILLACMKLTVGLVAGSVAIAGDGINNLTDSASSVATLLGFRMAQRPADREHPFGHGRYEYVSGVAVAVLVLLAGVELAKSSLDKILHPSAVPATVLTWAVLLVSIGLKLWMMVFNQTLGKKINSRTLEATALDSWNDVIATSAVLLALLCDSLLHVRLDGYAGMGVAVFILWSGIGLVRDTVSPLIGNQADEALVQELKEMILSHRRVLGIHDLLIHDYGAGRCFATVHAEMDASESPLDSHDQLDHIEQEALLRLGVHLVIHCDPVGDWKAYYEMAMCCAAEISCRFSIHDLRVVNYEDQQKLTFDLAVPYDEPAEDAGVIRILKAAMEKKGCPLPVEIHIDRRA